MRKGFSLLEAFLAIALIGVMGAISFYYINIPTLSSIQQKTHLQSHITLISSMILECKSYSEMMPKQIGGANAAGTLVQQLECQTSPVYLLNGGRIGFVPLPPSGFDPYKATESIGGFFITLSANQGSVGDKVLESIGSGYLPQQATFHHAGGKALLDIYLSH